MNGRLSWAIFWALIGVFVVIVSGMTIAAFIPAFRGSMFLWFIAVSGTIFFLLGTALIFFTVKEKVGGMLKKFLILTGASAVGIPVSIFLHNAIYGLFIYWFGADFWDRTGLAEEPFFFIMAIFVCPIGFLVGAVGRVVLFIKRRQ